ncbi:hypothetical protein EDD29_4894 [Actinocorallia herbida]|uniref:Uncharacterized protein n=1 Tax=Actinocorallia herbida TaxID=58109 RepID=A0A3N1D191_9ACTN|nr:DUF6518 family protein [Actinocorallia herbida]ROO87297.1 hypothetical protein EDD29_4894 [Actinocorallia herbida]
MTGSDRVSRLSRPWSLCALALVVGLAGGALTSFGQSVLTGGWHALVNSAAPWVMVAFLVGSCARGRWRGAVVAGLLSQAGLVAGYYVTSELRGYAAGTTSVLIWIAAGTIAGPVYAAAGSLLADGRRRIRATAAGVTGSVWIMEGLNFLSLASDANSNSGPGRTAAWCYLLIGVLLPVALARSARDRAYALPALLCGAAAATAAAVLINRAFLL